MYILVVSLEEKFFLFLFSFLVCLFAFETTDIAIDGVKVHIVRSLKSGNKAVTLISVFYLLLAQYKFSHCVEQVRSEQLVVQSVYIFQITLHSKVVWVLISYTMDGNNASV